MPFANSPNGNLLYLQWLWRTCNNNCCPFPPTILAFSSFIMSETSCRPSLPTSSSDFALPPTSTSSPDDANPLLYRFRRPSILAPKATYSSETRLSSPLSTLVSIPLPRRSRRFMGEEPDAYRDRMWTDSSPSSSSENPTPPLGPPIETDSVEHHAQVGKRPRSPSTPPPRNTSPASASMDTQELPLRSHARRSSHPVSYAISLYIFISTNCFMLPS